MRPVVTAEEMRTVEERFVQNGGDLESLMRQAGMQVASRIPSGKAVLVLAGPGNNGGDALIAASILRERGDDVRVCTYKRGPHGKRPSGNGDGNASDSESREESVAARSPTDQRTGRGNGSQNLDHASHGAFAVEDSGGLDRLHRELAWADVIVDGLLGIGRKRPIEGTLAEIVELANGAAGRRIAVDLPTGVDVNTGAVDTVAFRSDRTVTLGFGKRGLWGAPGADYAGEIGIADIGFAPDSASAADCFLLDPEDIKPLLPRRTRDWNKGKSGRLLVIAGSANYSGAPTLVSTAAYRSGAGLVDLAVPSSIRPVVATREVETIFSPFPSVDSFGPEAMGSLENSLESAKAVVAGPGLGPSPETEEFMHLLLSRVTVAGLPLVIDADGLNAIAKWDKWWRHVPKQTVVTPHPGEMGRLLGCSTWDVQADRFSSAANAAKTWGVVVVLKGSNTIVAVPGEPLRICPLGGPNLATGGTGDVLTGIIGGYLAQGLSAAAAATAAVWVHASAGERLRAHLGDAGTIASDLWAEIPKVQKELIGS